MRSKNAGIVWSWADAGGTVQLVSGVAAAATVAAITSVVPLMAPGWIAMLVVAGLAGGTLGRWAVGGGTGTSVLLRAVSAGAGLAVLLASCVLPPVLFLTLDRPSTVEDVAAAWMWLAVASGVVGAPLGAAIALFYSPLLVVAANAKRTPSHASGEHVARFGAVWLLAVAAVQGWFVSATSHVEPSSGARSVVGAFAWLAPLVCGAALVPLGIVARRHRRRWLEKVRAGEIAGYRVAPLQRDLDVADKGLLPVEHGAAPESCGEVLVRVAEERCASYREAAAPVEDEPLALLARQ
jgi:hypothetical protein